MWHLDKFLSFHMRVCARARVRWGGEGLRDGEREMCVLRASRSNAQRRLIAAAAALFPTDETRTQTVELTFMSQFRRRVWSRSLLKCVQERGGVLLSALCALPSVCAS